MSATTRPAAPAGGAAKNKPDGSDRTDDARAMHDSRAETDAQHGSGAGHGTLRGYLIGFMLSVILTAIPFWLVMSGILASQLTTALVIMGFAAAQIVVHMIFFLHMTTKAEEGWSLMALGFTVVVLVITLSGSLWVMYHMNSNMMPMAPQDMSRME